MDEKSIFSVTQGAETSKTADPPSLEFIPQPASLDLPLQSQTTIQPIAIYLSLQTILSSKAGCSFPSKTI
jgi:hypothetical protein